MEVFICCALSGKEIAVYIGGCIESTKPFQTMFIFVTSATRGNGHTRTGLEFTVVLDRLTSAPTMAGHEMMPGTR